MKQERSNDWVRLLPFAVLAMNSQESSSNGSTPHVLFHGGHPAWFFKTPFPEDYRSPVGDWTNSTRGWPHWAYLLYSPLESEAR